MLLIFRRIITAFALLLCCMLANKAAANHLFGADFNYTWVSGNTYTLRLTIYGDCAGAFTQGSSFNGLNGGTPKIYIYKNSLLIDSVSLTQSGAGVEVTPVCPSQANQTKCSVPNSTIQGVKRYIYTKNYTLNGTSANWLFQFNGDLPNTPTSYLAGRSTSITNINQTSGSIMRLEATLNNLGGNNSSPAYTTIPTPFFCINKPASYNPGTVDANGDVLSFSLIDGLEAIPPNSVGGNVLYIPGFSGANPLAVVPTTFSFNNSNGQLDFTPSTTGNYLVVSRVAETRGSVVVGTSMREMVFVIVPCNNNPPTGTISSPSAGVTSLNSTTINVCKEQGAFTFKINPTDIDGDVINVTATGLPAGATFNITNNNTTAPQGIFSWNVSAVTPGTYTFFVTYTDQGCPLASKQTVAYTINVLPNPNMTFNLVSPATCLLKAVFTLTPVNGINPNTFTFGTVTRSGVTGTITDSLSPGTYTFTITSSNGCSHDTSITIVSPVNINLAAAIRSSTCSTLADGKVVLTASNGTTPYTYAQGTGTFGSANTFSPLAAGTYVFRVKDNLGCTKDTTVTVNDSLIISGNAAVTNVLCFNGATGSIAISGIGGASPYTFASGAGTYSGTNTFGGLNAGNYTIHIKDNNGCIKDTVVTIAQPTALGVTATVQNVKCNGGNDGSVTLTGTGGTTPYTYAVGAGAYSSNATIGSLAVGSFTFHVKDANGCIRDTTITITQPTKLAFTFAVTNVLCNGGSTGTVTITATGGTPAYTYASDAGAFGASSALSGLNAGTHIIHLKDANGCIKDSTITITQPAVLGVTATAATPPLCNGGSNGTITIAGNGGTTPYAYAIGTGAFAATGTFNSLIAGTYQLHVKDANNCTKDTAITLIDPTPIVPTAQIKRPLCTPLVNGAVTLSATGGTTPYVYAAGTGTYSSSPLFSNLGSGTYTFHIKDSRGCVKDTTITVTDSIFVHATVTTSPAKCYNEASGSIAIAGSGGTSPYTFAMGSGAYTGTSPINNILAGSYVLHVKDNNGCLLDTNISVTQPANILPTVAITQPKCFGDSNGILTAGASGGTPAYTFALGGGAFGTNVNFTGLAIGTYVIHVKDNNGCLHDTTVTMGQPTPLKIDAIAISNVKCFGDSSGFVTVTASGATPAYTFAADSRAFAAGNVVNNLKVGAHIIHVKDANGCTKDSIVTLTQPTKGHVLITDIVTPTCEGYRDGRISINATGGTPGYTFSKDNVTFDTQKVYARIPEGTYTFYAKDAFGCVNDTTMDLIGYPHIVIHGVAITPPSCHGFEDASFALNVTGGNQPLTYVLSMPRDTNMTGMFDSLFRGSYAIHIYDTSKCFKDTTVSISEPDSLLVSTTVTPNDCNGYDDGGAVVANVTGGTTPYSYLWSTNPAQTTDRITGMPNGPYIVYVTDAHNCRDTAKAIVAYDNCCKPFIPDAFTPNADGKNDQFRVRWKGDIKLLNFSIYNRYGQRLFYTVSTEQGWDGTWNDKPQDLGTYFYYIKMVCGNGGNNVVEFKGDVTLIR